MVNRCREVLIISFGKGKKNEDIVTRFSPQTTIKMEKASCFVPSTPRSVRKKCGDVESTFFRLQIETNKNNAEFSGISMSGEHGKIPMLYDGSSLFKRKCFNKPKLTQLSFPHRHKQQHIFTFPKLPSTTSSLTQSKHIITTNIW